MLVLFRAKRIVCGRTDAPAATQEERSTAARECVRHGAAAIRGGAAFRQEGEEVKETSGAGAGR